MYRAPHSNSLGGGVGDGNGLVPITPRKRACDSCHRRKIQCDGATPQCNWCRHHSLPCTFVREFGRKRRAKAVANPRTGSRNDLVKRMDRIERFLDVARQALNGTQRHWATAGPRRGPPAAADSPSGAARQGSSLTTPTTSPPGQERPFQAEIVDALAGELAWRPHPQEDYQPPPLPQSQPEPEPQPQQRTCILAEGDPEARNGSISSTTTYGHDRRPSSQVDGHSTVSSCGDGIAASGRSFGELRFAGFALGEISSYNGIPFFSAEGQDWIRSRTGEDPSFENLFAGGPLWQRHPRGWRAGDAGGAAVQARREQQQQQQQLMAVQRASGGVGVC